MTKVSFQGKVYTMRQADIVGTSRDQATIDPVMAKIALLGDIFAVIESDRMVGTFVDAGLTAGTEIIVHDDNSVISFYNGLLRAGICTGRIIAVPAQVDLELEFGLILADLRPVFTNGNQPDAVGSPVFLLAGHLAGTAAPAEVIIYF